MWLDGRIHSSLSSAEGDEAEISNKAAKWNGKDSPDRTNGFATWLECFRVSTLSQQRVALVCRPDV